MARGWESKSVEDQIQAADEGPDMSRIRRSPREIEIDRQRDGLIRQRKRVLRDLAKCTNDRYRQVLDRGLEHLEAQLRKLGWTPPPGGRVSP